MPELTLPIRGRGVLVKVLVRPRSGSTANLHEINRVMVGPVSAFIDTGASDTMFDLGVIQSLGLAPVQSAALNILGCAEVRYHETFEVEVALVMPEETPRWTPLTVLSGAVFSTGAAAALGRDFLRQIVFTYDGPKEQARLRW